MKIKSLFTPNQSAFKRAASLFLTGAAALLFQAAVVQPAYAHHPIVSAATPACVNGTIVINFTITSWDVGSVFGSAMQTVSQGRLMHR